MASFKKICVLAIGLLLSISGWAQRGHGHRGHGHGRHHHGKVVVKRSVYRPKAVVVFHPVWRPKWSCSRRWVFFPKYNIYWDNWRNHYCFWNGAIWISQPSPPPVVVNVNLADEKHYELKETEDDNDEIGGANNEHKKEYKPD
jgi:hypothetical protein